MEHDRNEVPDLISDFLLCKFERLGGRSSEGSAQEDHRLNMGIDHILIFSANQVTDLLGVLYTRLSIAINSCLEDTEPVIHKVFGVFSRRAEVYQLDLPCP